MQILASKKAVDSSNSSDFTLKPPPHLAAVSIKISFHRLIIFRTSYFLFALCLGLAFYPFILDRLLWIFPAILSTCVLWVLYCREMKSELTGALGFAGNQWVFEQLGKSSRLELSGEVLCWPWLIIMPFKDMLSGKSRRVVLFGDSLSREDNTRLRAWLRASLIPKA